MDIVTLTGILVESILKAEQEFFDNPDRMSVFEEAVADASHRFAASFISGSLELMDEALRSSIKRREKYTIQRHDNRSLITTVGDVSFKQTLYRNKETGEYRYLLEDLIKLPGHERFSSLAEAKALYEAEVHSYQHAADSLSMGDQTVSKTAIMDKVHSVIEDIPDIAPPGSEEKKQCKYLYIEADEDHIHRQKDDPEKGCMIGKLIYLFEDKQEVCKGRKILINAHYLGGLYQGSEGNKKLWMEVQKYIEDHYDIDYLERVYISSDGGAWIKAGKEYVDKSVLVADRFHLMKYIYRVANLTLDDRDETKARFYRYIYKNNLLAAKKMLTRIKNSAGHDDVIENTRSYFENNWDAIQRAFHDKHVIGCSAEGHVSNVLSERMSSRPMGWSEVGSDRMCKLRCYVRNKGQLIDLVEYRRKKLLDELKATGTDGWVEPKPKVYYSQQQRQAMAYIERMQASIGGVTVKKMLAIKDRLNEL